MLRDHALSSDAVTVTDATPSPSPRLVRSTVSVTAGGGAHVDRVVGVGHRGLTLVAAGGGRGGNGVCVGRPESERVIDKRGHAGRHGAHKRRLVVLGSLAPDVVGPDAIDPGKASARREVGADGDAGQSVALRLHPRDRDARSFRVDLGGHYCDGLGRTLRLAGDQPGVMGIGQRRRACRQQGDESQGDDLSNQSSSVGHLLGPFLSRCRFGSVWFWGRTDAGTGAGPWPHVDRPAPLMPFGVVTRTTREDRSARTRQGSDVAQDRGEVAPPTRPNFHNRKSSSPEGRGAEGHGDPLGRILQEPASRAGEGNPMPSRDGVAIPVGGPGPLRGHPPERQHALDARGRTAASQSTSPGSIGTVQSPLQRYLHPT